MKNSTLTELVRRVRAHRGLKRKKGVREIVRTFRDVADFGWTALGPGDDAGAIRDKDGYLLLTADGVMPEFLRANPFRAGMASVLVNVNDICILRLRNPKKYVLIKLC